MRALHFILAIVLVHTIYSQAYYEMQSLRKLEENLAQGGTIVRWRVINVNTTVQFHLLGAAIYAYGMPQTLNEKAAFISDMMRTHHGVRGLNIMIAPGASGLHQEYSMGIQAVFDYGAITIFVFKSLC